MIHTYRLISLILYPLLVLIIYLRKVFNKEDKVRFKEKLFYSSFLNNFNNSRKLIWSALSMCRGTIMVKIFEIFSFNLTCVFIQKCSSLS